jgi:uracil-DNA glycosylase
MAKPILLKSPTSNMKISELALTTTPTSWRKVFEDAKDEYSHIENILSRSEFFPLPKNIFRCFDLTPLPNVQVVLLGKEPYATRKPNGFPKDQGLCYSVSRGDEVPIVLKNILKEAGQPTLHGDLSSWGAQGVLLLNVCLTVPMGKPGGNGILWDGLIYRVFEAIAEVNPSCIYVIPQNLSDYKKYIPQTSIFLDTPPVHIPKFLGCGVFQQINDELIKQRRDAIDWSL